MSDLRYAHLWQVWGYPDDPKWDGKTFDVGYTTENGSGTTVATDLTKENAEYIVGLVQRAAVSKQRRELLLRKRDDTQPIRHAIQRGVPGVEPSPGSPITVFVGRG